MNNLNEALQNVIEKIKKYRSFYEQNEMAVRDQIINPILRNLEWNTEDPDEVQPNVSIDEGVPDYSLIKNGKKIIFIEAKRLGIDIDKKDTIRQLGKYCYSEGTKYGILTNGAIWILIRSFEEGIVLTERTVLRIDLENEGIQAIFRKIKVITKSNIENIEVLVKKTSILDKIWQNFLKDPTEIIIGLMPVVKSIISKDYPPEYQFEDTEIEDFLKERVKEIILGTHDEEVKIIDDVEEPVIFEPGRNPSKMKLKGDIFVIHKSFEILINTSNWLIENGKLKISDCPIEITRGNRYFIHKEPKHRSGKNFTCPKKLSNGLWIETHCSTDNGILYSKKLLEKFGFSPDSLVIEWS